MPQTTHALLSLASRILLSAIFIIAGWQKISGFAATGQYMEAFGVPSALLPLAIVLELGGGLAILLGVKTRPIALLLAAFCLVTAAVFHMNFADSVQMVLFLKNLAIAGGFLAIAANGPGRFALGD